ncbi:hypothetical protein PENANT_c031G11692 [Penicillium antarcticum]|uniref:Uncharacterized protein n=1 Tax=Penicillium antarcticum TaxID=416450 RepID=A0A1V6PUX8_9EURO|nr:hypothetical protein PENANT_c031G11692 [Penicillium antarcticum]
MTAFMLGDKVADMAMWL